MWTSTALPHLALGLAALSGTLAQSYNDIPEIEAYGQHFFYKNNGSQFYLKGVAYQENYSPNGTSDTANNQYTDPLADGSKCSRDIPFMKKIFTNVIRVYAIDPTQNHDDCMEQLASNDIYVIADLSEPGTSIDSNDPSWNVPLYTRYTAVVDSLSKYKNVIGFFAGNEVVSAQNQTSAAAFVKAAVRDTKGYIKQMNYRTTLGVGYATADVPSRNELAHYFACGDAETSIDFWGYNVYSWCGDSNYETSSYGERVDFFKDYPVPVFFAEYGCIEVPAGAERRPFTEVPVLYGNMTSVFSGGIVYEWFHSDNKYGLVEINDNSVSPYPDYTSLSSQLAKVTPSITQSSAYKPSNTAPACPSVGGTTWAAAASPLPPAVNPQLCSCEVANLDCTVDSDDSDSYGDTFDFICSKNEDYCAGIAHNATTGTYGAIGGCSPKQQLAWVANQYYQGQSNKASACDFGGLAKTQSPSTSAGCEALISAAGTDGKGSVPSPTGQQGTAAASSSSKGAAAGTMTAPSFFNYGSTFFAAYVITALVSGVGMFVL
ncbi:carbohydrate-binding module family 43 protein [Hypoxylon trugodes]|uniref:carbohydrate-binding module family 43 protein n=1 Tax=Hypoxylon trugodes TaxID=326681 RepID=UPI00219569EF|nr:carbohydrate-binding module family 43 protein [Hypoxylon trugodes]KAI1387667.1 carbohydrate-binding module family 43 protein [Hypoxylon trugodes]